MIIENYNLNIALPLISEIDYTIFSAIWECETLSLTFKMERECKDKYKEVVSKVKNKDYWQDHVENIKHNEYYITLLFSETINGTFQLYDETGKVGLYTLQIVVTKDGYKDFNDLDFGYAFVKHCESRNELEEIQKLFLIGCKSQDK